MSERMDLILNEPGQFDRAVHGDDRVPALPSGSDLAIITKDGGMQSGRAVAVITFTVEVNGKLRRAQYTVSVRHLKALGAWLNGAYDDEGMRRFP